MDQEQLDGRRTTRRVAPAPGPEAGMTDDLMTRDPGMVPAPVMDRHARRRLAAEAAADAAEAAAAAAADRATAAIKAAARAAEEAEDAADAAARAADAALAAAADEARFRRPRQVDGHAANGHAVNGHAANGHAVNGHAVNGNRAHGLVNGSPGRIDVPDDTTVIPPVRTGGRRHRYYDATPDEPISGGEPSARAEKPAPVRRVLQQDAARDPATDALAISEVDEYDRDAADDLEAVLDDRDDRDDRDDEARDVDAPVERVAQDEFDAVDPRPTRRSRRVRRDDEVDELDDRDAAVDVDDEDDEDDDERGSWLGRPMLYAVGGVLVIVGLIAALVMMLGGGGESTSAQTAAQQTDGAAGAPAAAGDGGATADRVDPTSDKAVAFLDALRDNGITTSRSGISETRAAAGICNQLDQGVDADTVAKSLPSQLPTISRNQAPVFIELVQDGYCA